MPGYVIAQAKVHDAKEIKKYLSGFMKAFSPFGGRILVSTDRMEILEGSWPQVRTIVLEFPSLAVAKEWYYSRDYQALAKHRFLSAETNMILIDGYEGQVTHSLSA